MLTMKKLLKTTIKILFVSCFIFGIAFFSKIDAYAGEMTMHSIYIGRGDAILIQSNGHYMLVDSGTNAGVPLLMDYLSKLDIPDNKIDYVVSTHPDGDHVGGFSEIFDKYDIGQVIYSPCTKASATYTDFIKYVKKEGCPFKNPVEGESWKLGDATVSVIYDGSLGSTYNECSIVLKVTCDNKSILLTGDLPSTMEHLLMDKGYNFKADILKVGHHGAAASSCASFLDAVDADYAVVSCSRKSTSVFPKPSVLKRLARRFVKTYRTTDDNVVITCKNGKITTKNKEHNGYFSIRRGKITLSNNVFYAGKKAIKPTVSLYVNGVLVPSSQYKVTYSSNNHTGFGKVKLKANEVKYVSTCSTTFMIRPQKETLNGTVSKYNNINLSWSKQSFATGYTIKYSTDKYFKKNVKYVTIKRPGKIARTLSNLRFNKTYYIKIRAYKSNIGNGKWSNRIKIKTKPAPVPAKQKISQCIVNPTGNVKLKWTKQSSKYNAGYRVQYSTDKKFKNKKKIKTVTYKSVSKYYRTLKNLKNNATYFIRIQGYNKYGDGKWSKIKSVKIQR